MIRRWARAGILAVFFWITFSLAGTRIFAEELASLNQEEKAEKRLQFNRFVEQELAREARAKTAVRHGGVAPIEKNWSITFTPSYGYERNVNLNSERQGDTYFEETIDAKIKFAHPGALFLGPGNWGIGGAGDFINYEHQKNVNYRQLVFNTFADSRLTSNLTGKFNYDLTSLDYIHDDQLGYLSHRLKPSLSYAWNKQWTQNFYSLWDIKDYSSRKALSPSNVSLEKGRLDVLTEGGTGFRFIPDTSKVFGVTTAYKRNDSNDIFNDLNDYQGLKVSGYAFFQLPANFSTIFYGGYDYKKYDSRTFLTDSDKTQEDDFFYAGSTLNYDLGNYVQLFFSYLYKQNYSNDPAQGYSDYVLSTGITAIF